jgi:putative redox protein
MITIKTTYEGDLLTKALHLKSDVTLVTDAPIDNEGKGSSFSPTDLMAASLGSCMLTIMGIACRKHDINMDGTSMNITKVMVSDPRRVSEIHVEFFMPANNYDAKQRKILEQAAKTCPVALSLHPDLKQIITFRY